MWRNFHTDFRFASMWKSISMRAAMIFIFLYSTSCSNALSTFADETELNSLYYIALEGVRDANYATAIEVCENMPSSFLTKARTAEPTAAEICASAYAGRSGFSILGMVDLLTTFNPAAPTSTLLEFFMTQLTSSAAANVTDSSSAIGVLRELGEAGSRSVDQNAFVALLALRTMGVIANESADKYSADADDGAVGGGFDACVVGSITDADARLFGLAFWELNQSLLQLATVSTDYSDLSSAVATICTALGVSGGDLCSAADPTALSAAQVNDARSLIKEGGAVGVDQCGGSTAYPACICP